jgi:hypothetical protein
MTASPAPDRRNISQNLGSVDPPRRRVKDATGGLKLQGDAQLDIERELGARRTRWDRGIPGGEWHFIFSFVGIMLLTFFAFVVFFMSVNIHLQRMAQLAFANQSRMSQDRRLSGLAHG